MQQPEEKKGFWKKHWKKVAAGVGGAGILAFLCYYDPYDWGWCDWLHDHEEENKIELIDSIDFSDDVSIIVERTRDIHHMYIGDVLGISDSVKTTMHHNEKLTDVVEISDSITTKVNRLLHMSDNVSIEDAVNTQVHRILETADSIGINDSVETTAHRVKEFSDSVIISDSVDVIAHYNRMLSDNLEIADSVTTTAHYVRDLSDSVGIKDDINVTAHYNRVLSDSIGIKDSVLTFAHYNKVLGDSLGISDSVETSVHRKVSVSDSLAISDDAQIEMSSEHTNSGISVCKIVIDDDGNVTDGSDLGWSMFWVPWLDAPNGYSGSGVKPPTPVFKLPLNLNSDLLYNDGVNDAECKSYENLPLGGYFYGQEVKLGGDWKDTLYNDQHNLPVGDLDDFLRYSDEIYNSDPDDDNERETNSDGHIVTTENRKDRTLVVVNEYDD